uniref:Elongator complex protein 2 n=1 Tax=Setaria digitata TaxID=48799 RepID=A0A915Q6H8_9BILA
MDSIDMDKVPECEVGVTFIGRGCQKYTKCLTWSKIINVVAFASAGDICFVVPKGNNRCMGINSTINAHTFPVTCLRFVSWYHCNTFDLDYLITGDANGTVRLWAVQLLNGAVVAKVIVVIVNEMNRRPINCCVASVITESNRDTLILAYAISDGSLVAEQIIIDRRSLVEMERQNYERILLQPAFIVSLTIHIISSENILFLLGTTSNNIEVICGKFAVTFSQLKKAATLRGHADWISSIDVRAYENDIWMASGGQDNIRIWRFALSNSDEICVSSNTHRETQFTLFEEVKGVANTMHITLEGVLSAHEDWIYSVEWHPTKLQLLSASNDKTLVIWEPSEIAAGLWVDAVRVGDVGGQAAGFLGACFSPDGCTILAYSYFGGFFSWQLEKVGQVKDIAWDPTGSYFLSCSHDQTTRCYAPSVDCDVISEIARPQVHGYDLTCITSISSCHFVSGADEKILRVFAAPRNFVEMLRTVSKYNIQEIKRFLQLFPDPTLISERNATVPALGLSNKIMGDVNIQENKGFSIDDKMNLTCDFGKGLLVEEYLMQDTLWPEIHKLYGHGFELFTVTSNHSGTLIATIIIWDSKEWRCRCELQYHKLTVVQIAFSNNDFFLLSVSRDRTFAIWVRSSQDLFDWKLQLNSDEKYSRVHSRIIWCCAWTPDDKYFVTGARDKKLCIWHFDGKDIQLVMERKHLYAVTAVDFMPKLWKNHYILAVGFENGEIEIERLKLGENNINNDDCLKRWSAHSETVNRLRFRPKEGPWLGSGDMKNNIWELASASNDHSVIIHKLILL